MPIGSGVAAQFAYKKETTPNTRVVPDHWIEFVDESLQARYTRIEATGRRAGRRTSHGWAVGNSWIEGGFSTELVPQSMGSMLELCFGGVNTTGAGPYVHTFTPGDLDTFTAQVGRPDTAGTVHAFDYVGCMINSWKITCDATGDGSMIGFEADVMGYEETTDETLATPSYPTVTRWTSVQASLTIAASAYCVDSFEIGGENGIRSNFEACAATPGKPNITENGTRVYSGTLVSDFKDLTAYNRFVNGTEAALVITIEASASAKLVITTNVRFDGETPNVSGADVLKQSLPFVCTSATGDSTTITAVLTNGDSAP